MKTKHSKISILAICTALVVGVVLLRDSAPLDQELSFGQGDRIAISPNAFESSDVIRDRQVKPVQWEQSARNDLRAPVTPPPPASMGWSSQPVANVGNGNSLPQYANNARAMAAPKVSPTDEFAWPQGHSTQTQQATETGRSLGALPEMNLQGLRQYPLDETPELHQQPQVIKNSRLPNEMAAELPPEFVGGANSVPFPTTTDNSFGATAPNPYEAPVAITHPAAAPATSQLPNQLGEVAAERLPMTNQPTQVVQLPIQDPTVSIVAEPEVPANPTIASPENQTALPRQEARPDRVAQLPSLESLPVTVDSSFVPEVEGELVKEEERLASLGAEAIPKTSSDFVPLPSESSSVEVADVSPEIMPKPPERLAALTREGDFSPAMKTVAAENANKGKKQESPLNLAIEAPATNAEPAARVATKPATKTPGNTSANTPAKEPAKTAKPKDGPSAVKKAGDFLMAAEPKAGDHYKDDTPLADRQAHVVPSSNYDFSPDPIHNPLPHDPGSQMLVYEGKKLNATQRPILELGRPWYQLGQLPEGSSIFGNHNRISPQLVMFGDIRTAAASNTNANGDNVTQMAFEANFFFDLHLTGTERFVWNWAPLDSGGVNTSYFFDRDFFNSEFDADIDFGYFEGDLGAMVGGFMGETLPFDAPFAIGVMPLLFQNGVWLEDAFLGAAATIPARNVPALNIANMDVTFFAGYDEIITPAFEGDDDVGKIYGIASFIEATNGYWEVDYAFLEDRDGARDRSYHNIGIGFTRRYGRFLSNSTRVIVNAGQSTAGGPNTADGVLLLSENSLITGLPSSIVPYFNMFAGFDRPQSAARAAGSGGVLRNTGILFESDGMTGYPTLDDTANDTFGAALGLNIMPNDWSQQLVVEMAALGVMGNDPNRNARGDQYGAGFRYQLPLTNAIIFRADGMYGWLRNSGDVHGVRMELRHKF